MTKPCVVKVVKGLSKIYATSSIENIITDPSLWKPARYCQFEAYLCKPPKGTFIVDRTARSSVKRLIIDCKNAEGYADIPNQIYEQLGKGWVSAINMLLLRTKHSELYDKLLYLGKQTGVINMRDGRPVSQFSESFVLYTHSGFEVLPHDITPMFLNMNYTPLNVGSGAETPVFDWIKVRMTPKYAEFMAESYVACFIPSEAGNGGIEHIDYTDIINSPTDSYKEKGCFLLARKNEGTVLLDNITVISGYEFRNKFSHKGWLSCLKNNERDELKPPFSLQSGLAVKDKLESFFDALMLAKGDNYVDIVVEKSPKGVYKVRVTPSEYWVFKWKEHNAWEPYIAETTAVFTIVDNAFVYVSILTLDSEGRTRRTAVDYLFIDILNPDVEKMGMFTAIKSNVGLLRMQDAMNARLTAVWKNQKRELMGV